MPTILKKGNLDALLGRYLAARRRSEVGVPELISLERYCTLYLGQFDDSEKSRDVAEQILNNRKKDPAIETILNGGVHQVFVYCMRCGHPLKSDKAREKMLGSTCERLVKAGDWGSYTPVSDIDEVSAGEAVSLMYKQDPLDIKVRHDIGGHHVHATFFTKNAGHYANSGTLVMYQWEWLQFKTMMEAGAKLANTTIVFEER